MGLLQRSMAAGILIVCTLVLRKFASNKLSRRVFTVLWKMAVLRLLLPFSFQAENIFIKKRISHVMVLAWKEAERATIETEALSVVQILLRHIGLVWLLGAVLAALFFAIGYVRAYFLFRESIPMKFWDSEQDIGKYCFDLTKGVKINVFDRIAAPITYGIVCPRIILPKNMDFTDKDILYYVLMHEMVHIKCMDNLWKFLTIVALCLHWFNPSVYVMFFFMNRDMEIACDESVISSMEERDRQKYAMTLVMLAEIHVLFPMICSGFGRSIVSERIREIMNYKKMTKAGSLCAVFVLLAGTVVFVSAKGTGVEEDSVSAEPLSAIATVGETTENVDYKDCVEVFFDSGISEERIKEIGNDLLAIDGVVSIGYTSAETAWSAFADNYLDEEIVVSFKENPLKDSASYTVYLSEKDESVINVIKNIDGVRHVKKNH